MDRFPSIPLSTYRLQFHSGFTFADARALVPYLHQLGVSHLYASPIFRATPGSIHGYDICDHNELNPEVGTREEFEQLLEELNRHEMKILLDFVPNHMGIAEPTNQWWVSVLEDGPSSPYAKYFDIDWSPLGTEIRGKVLLAILDDQYGRVLERGQFALLFQEGALFLQYGDRLLPTSLVTILPLLRAVIQDLSPEVPTELESIVYALHHLPSNDETDSLKIREKSREKELLRTRLASLCEENLKVRRAVERAIQRIYGAGTQQSFDDLDAFIRAQSYRLAYWRVASEEINYRRFFDVNDLAALRMHLPDVFATTHRLLFELLKNPTVGGLRIDHIDGLSDPLGYLEKLQSEYADLHRQDARQKPLYLLVEKILASHESLRADWPVHGTTGYEFAAQVTNLLVAPKAATLISRFYERFTGLTNAFSECAYQGKSLVMRTSMPSEVNMLAHMLHGLAQSQRWYRDFTLNTLSIALREVIACFPVYRSYISKNGAASPGDRHLILRAIATARRRNAGLERTVFEFIRDVLLPPSDQAHPVDEAARQEFVLRFQQSTGPITAKGVEDTALYVYNRFVALNEVGGDPAQFGETVNAFHQRNILRSIQQPHCLLSTSTHDTKRSEDVRARLAAISEMPREWIKNVRLWHQANRRHRKKTDGAYAPDANEEYLLYQTLLGSWPLHPMSGPESEVYIHRIQQYMVKAIHEAKVNSSWMEPNQVWEDALKEFVQKILSPETGAQFLKTFLPFAEKVAHAGAVNSITQVILKLTVPGVPDLYQGQENWDFSLVDPDNRRPVNFNFLQNQSARPAQPPAELFQNWRDGRIKFFVTNRLLEFRREHRQLFEDGDYEPLQIEGKLASHVVGFTRTTPVDKVLVLVPRCTAHLSSLTGSVWDQTFVKIPADNPVLNILTGSLIHPASGPLPVSQLFQDLPFAAIHLSHSR